MDHLLDAVIRGLSAKLGFICACVLAAAGATSTFAGTETEATASGGRLRVTDQYNIPMKEISGLALVRGDPASIDIYAVGDTDYELGRFRQQGPGQERSIEVRDMANRLSAGASGASQWEAIAADGARSICILAESTSKVVCLDRALRKELSRFSLDVSTIGSLERLWQAEPNSRGEGMILMRQGRVLLLKRRGQR